MHQSKFIELGQSNPDFGKPISLTAAIDSYRYIFDSLDQHKCYGYLSMLAKYIEVTKDMTEAEMKLYLVRAEYRYFRYINHMRSTLPKSTYPLDIAIFMQEHKANADRFDDDCDREFSYNYYELDISDFDTIVDNHNKNTPPLYWEDRMGLTEPPHLTKDNIMSLSQTGYAELTCIICYIDLQVKWQDFAEWRLDHKTALCCHRCKSRFTMDHVGKANLIIDLHKSLLYPYSHYGRAIIGKTHWKIAQYVKSIDDLKDLPFDSGLDAIKRYLVKNQKEETRIKKKDDGSIDAFIEAAKSTYFGSPYICSSSDLIKKLAGNYAFHYAVTQKLKWTAQDLHKMPLDYVHFTRLNQVAAKKRNVILVSTYKTEIARRTYFIMSQEFRVKRHNYVDAKIAGINAVIPYDQEDRYIQITKRKWDVLKVPRLQDDTTLSSKKANLSALLQKIASIAKPGHLYDKYEVKEAYISKLDSVNDFENLKFMSQYSTLRSLDRSASDWSTFSFTRVLPTTGSELKLMEGRSLKPSYYPYTSEDPQFNWCNASRAWCQAFVDVKDFSGVEHRWYYHRATIGSPMVDKSVNVIFNEALANAERHRILAQKRRAQRIKKEAMQRSKRSFRGGASADSSNHYGYYDIGGYGGDTGGSGGGECSGGGDSGGGGGGGDGGGGGGGGCD